jgi:exosortase A-associated hydrolase 1
MRSVSERPITFECRGDTLVGVLHSPAHPAQDIGVLVVVGGPQYRVGSHRQFVLVARALAESGFRVFRFDYRGMGDSEGSMCSFEDVGPDIAAAIDVLLREQPSLTGVVLWGLCDAASACLIYCKDDPRVRGLILVNPWVRTVEGEARARLRHYYLQRLFQRSFWRSALDSKFKMLKSARDFFGSMTQARSVLRMRVPAAESFIERMEQGLQSFRGYTLFLISEKDLAAREFLDLCRGSPSWKVLVSRPSVRFAHLSGTDHTFSTREALDRASEECRRWLASLPQA